MILRLGRAQKLQGPRTAIILPCIDSYTRIDLRINAFHVPPMQVITVDQGLVELGATVFFQVINIFGEKGSCIFMFFIALVH